MRALNTALPTVLFAVFISSASVQAAAQDSSRTSSKPYVSVAVGQSLYTSGGFSCWSEVCRESKPTLFKVGGGYPVGALAIEGWLIDFGNAKYSAVNDLASDNAHLRALVAGGAWTGRFGPVFEATFRAGAAGVQVSSDGRPSKWSLRPIVGATAGLRFSEAMSAELSLDVIDAKDKDQQRSSVIAHSLGLRYRF